LIPNSLRFRLLGAAVAIIVLAVQIAGLFVLFLFERNVIRLVHSDLDTALEQLAKSLTFDVEGKPALKAEPPDVRFRQRLAGRYWQLSLDDRPLLRSPSLGDGALHVKSGPLNQREGWRQAVVGPDDQKLYASIRRVVLNSAAPAPGQRAQDYLLIVAMDVAEIATLDALNTQLRGNMFTALGLLALILIAAAWAQVSIGLHPLEMLRTAVENIRVGNARRMSDDVPTELRPLVTETNRLLEAQEKALEAARARAGDLAHGLKTPLTALALVAQKLRQQEPDLAGELEQQLKGLNAHVERELTRTRIAANATVTQKTLVHPIATRLLKTMEKLPRGEHIKWSLHCARDFAAPVEAVDLAEILGNLLDNARKWARSEVALTARSAAANVELCIEDDGPGVSEADHARVMRRGTRLDESVPGSGLGLNITQAVVEAYGGKMALDRSARGGLLVRLSLPRQQGR
jgi:signal transduction histidine kinase